MLMKILRRSLLAAAAGCLATVALAQVVEVTHPANLTRLQVADEVLLPVPTGDSSDPYDYWYTPGGRFKLWTGPNTPTGRGGNPTYEGDENRLIASIPGPTGTDPADPAYYGDWTSGFLVAVDPDDPDNAQFIDPFELALNQSQGDNPSDLTRYWLQNFSAGSRDAVGIARIPIETDSNGNPSGWVRINVEYKLIGDTLQIAIVLTNEGQIRTTLGCAFASTRALVTRCAGATTASPSSCPTAMSSQAKPS